MYEEWAAAGPKQHSGTKISVVEFVPPPKETVDIYKFDIRSMGPIRFGYHWRVARVDVRRKNLRGRPPLSNTLTSLTIRWSGVCGMPWKYNAHPQLATAVAEDDAVPELREEEEKEEDEEVLDKSTQIFNGWRTSYCKLDTAPERRKRLERYLASGVKACGPEFQRFGPPPMGRATAKVREAKEKEERGKHNLRGQNWRRFYKGKRQ